MGRRKVRVKGIQVPRFALVRAVIEQCGGWVRGVNSVVMTLA